MKLIQWALKFKDFKLKFKLQWPVWGYFAQFWTRPTIWQTVFGKYCLLNRICQMVFAKRSAWPDNGILTQKFWLRSFLASLCRSQFIFVGHELWYVIEGHRRHPWRLSVLLQVRLVVSRAIEVSGLLDSAGLKWPESRDFQKRLSKRMFWTFNKSKLFSFRGSRDLCFG